jgi:hypothetical protein
MLLSILGAAVCAGVLFILGGKVVSHFSRHSTGMGGSHGMTWKEFFRSMPRPYWGTVIAVVCASAILVAFGGMVEESLDEPTKSESVLSKADSPLQSHVIKYVEDREQRPLPVMFEIVPSSRIKVGDLRSAYFLSEGSFFSLIDSGYPRLAVQADSEEVLDYLEDYEDRLWFESYGSTHDWTWGCGGLEGFIGQFGHWSALRGDEIFVLDTLDIMAAYGQRQKVERSIYDRLGDPGSWHVANCPDLRIKLMLLDQLADMLPVRDSTVRMVMDVENVNLDDSIDRSLFVSRARSTLGDWRYHGGKSFAMQMMRVIK